MWAGLGTLLGWILVCLNVLFCVEETDCLVTLPLPFVSPASMSTVADAYRWLNHTMGNRTDVEEGYYYLNNFDNILNSFGECRSHRLEGHSWACCPCTTASRCGIAKLCGASPSQAVCHFLEFCLALMEHVVCPAFGVQSRPDPRTHSAPRFYSFSGTFSVSGSRKA